MMSIEFLIKLSIVLTAGVGVYASCRRTTAACRYLLCVATLGASLLLPALFYFPPIAPQSNKIFTFVVTATEKSLPTQALTGVLPGLWLAGSCFVLLWWSAGYMRLRLRIARNGIEVPAEIRTESKTFLPRTVLAPVTTPFTMGWLKPMVVLPRDFPLWDEAARRLVYLHESQHLRRGDTWALLLGTVARALYWFHPLVWWLAARLEEEQEAACDEAVLQANVEPSSYAEVLVGAARRRQGSTYLVCPMASSATELQKRVQRILAFRKNATSRMVSRLAATLGMAAVLVACFWTPAAARTTQAKPVYSIEAVNTAPALISKKEPGYSRRAKKDKVQGVVLLSLIVDVDGKAKQIHVENGLEPGLDANAIKAVKLWRFKPGVKDGSPVPVRAKVEVHFRLL
jgi:TonB family protein